MALGRRSSGRTCLTSLVSPPHSEVQHVEKGLVEHAAALMSGSGGDTDNDDEITD